MPDAPNGSDWKAVVLNSATGTRFIKIDRPLTISVLTTLVFSDGSANSVNFVSDSGVTVAPGSDSSQYLRSPAVAGLRIGVHPATNVASVS